MTTTTVANETPVSFQESLQPLAELTGQHNQLEAWVNDSCQALEKLHGELAEWQNELARKQTELDLREDALEKYQENEDELGSQVDEWKAELEAAQLELQQVSDENTDHLEQLEQLERRCIELESELKLAQQRSAELAETLEAERARAAEEQVQWKAEFKGMRDLLDKQCSLLATQLKPGEKPDRPAVAAVGVEASARSQELRRRAQLRLAAKRRQQQDQDDAPNREESDES